jgi:hypothetical protein
MIQIVPYEYAKYRSLRAHRRKGSNATVIIAHWLFFPLIGNRIKADPAPSKVRARALNIARILGYLFTGNRYKRIKGAIHVKHPGGKWINLAKHMERQKKLRLNK